jgi:hypothetical protein
VVPTLLGSFAVVGVAAAMAELGTFATLTSSTSASHTISSGTVSIALGATGASTNHLTVDASNVVPGDTIQRSVSCGDVIGAYEPLVVLHEGRAHSTSKAAEANVGGTLEECYHHACYTARQGKPEE